LAILVGSAALGVAVNHFSPRGIPLLPRTPEQTLTLPNGLASISLDDAKAAFEEQTTLFLDARSPDEYEQGHIPGALSLPPRDFEDRFLDIMDAVETAPSIVVYCQGTECSDAIESAERLLEVRTDQIFVFEAGLRAWLSAGGPVAEGPEP
jgi:rhodanese-related sulfurtransferase